MRKRKRMKRKKQEKKFDFFSGLEILISFFLSHLCEGQQSETAQKKFYGSGNFHICDCISQWRKRNKGPVMHLGYSRSLPFYIWSILISQLFHSAEDCKAINSGWELI